MVGGAGDLSGASFLRALSLFLRVPLLDLKDLSEAPPPKALIFGVRTSTYEFWRDTFRPRHGQVVNPLRASLSTCKWGIVISTHL